jgi:hypothetical protein
MCSNCGSIEVRGIAHRVWARKGAPVAHVKTASDVKRPVLVPAPRHMPGLGRNVRWCQGGQRAGRHLQPVWYIEEMQVQQQLPLEKGAGGLKGFKGFGIRRMI